MSEDPVLFDVVDHVATLTLNLADRRNAMTPALLQRFAERVEEVRANTDVRVLVVRGTGKYFCNGADFASIGEMAGKSGLPGTAGMREAVRKIYGSFLGLLKVEVPTIAHVNGHAIGGGLGLALACDMRVAAKEAKLGANFTRLGLSPGMAISYILPRLVGVPRAAELLFTGRIVTGDVAASLGLVNYACAREELDAKVDSLAREIALCAPVALRLAKRALYSGLGFEPERALDFEAFAQSACLDTKDFREGVAAMFERRDPKFEGR